MPLESHGKTVKVGRYDRGEGGGGGTLKKIRPSQVPTFSHKLTIVREPALPMTQNNGEQKVFNLFSCITFIMIHYAMCLTLGKPSLTQRCNAVGGSM